MSNTRRQREILLWALIPWGPLALAMLWLQAASQLGNSAACTGPHTPCDMPLSDIAVVVALFYSAVWPLLLAVWLMAILSRIFSLRRAKVGRLQD